MTNSEAINFLKGYLDEEVYTEKCRNAHKMAIKALEQEPCEDVVSRNAIIQTLNNMDRYVANELILCDTNNKFPQNEVFIVDDVFEQIAEQLPSVTPKQQTCEDCISRQAAIDCLNADFTIDGKENMETVVDYINGAFKQIKALPSVTPQQKVGKWIMKHRTYNKVKHYTGQDEMGETHTISVLERYEVNEPYCSKCGKLAGDTSQDFCCACGAKMEVKE